MEKNHRPHGTLLETILFQENNPLKESVGFHDPLSKEKFSHMLKASHDPVTDTRYT